MKIEELFEDIEILDERGEIDKEAEIKNISYHSGKVNAGDLFVAIRGYKTDGHIYIEDAKEKGACLAVVEEFCDVDIPMIKVSNSRETLADLSSKFYKNPSEKLNVIGITATNGKTTTTFMTEEIFKAYGINAGSIGTVDVNYGDVKIPSVLTTPESRDLQEHLKNMADFGVTDVIMEVSSHAQEMGRVRNVDFDIVTFNNLSREHIDQHGSFENYYNFKKQLIVNAKEDAIAILNFDEDKIRVLKNETRARVLSYSFLNDDEDFSISNLDLSTGFAKYDFHINRDIEYLGITKGTFEIELGVAGYSGVMNSVVAIIISLIRKIPISVIKCALKDFKGVERRFQVILDDRFKVVDDHYANAKNISTTMETLEKMDFNNLFMVYALRGGRGVNVNRESAEEAAKWLNKLGVKSIVLSSSIGNVEEKDRVSEEERKVVTEVMKKHDINTTHYDTLGESMDDVLGKISDGDLLLLAGCQGMDAGGRIFLEKYTKDMEPEKRNEIMKVLDGRAF